MHFIVYTTPGPHGYCPGDIDRRWSLSSKTTRDLQPFQIQEYEPVTEWAARLFREYREVRTRVLTHMAGQSQRRADAINRHRKNMSLSVGDLVAIKDKHKRKSGGGVPHGINHCQRL